MDAVEAVVAVAEEVATTTMRDLSGEVEEIEEDVVVVEAVAAKMASHMESILKTKPMQSNIIHEVIVVEAEAEEADETSSNSMSKEDRTTHAITKEEMVMTRDSNVSILNKRSVTEWLETKIRIN